MVKLKNNGLSQGDKVDTMNLLDTSDSDVEWLNLPPLKGKKPKRKKTVRAKVPGCSLWSFVKPVMCITVLGAVVLLIITTVWLTAQVGDLRAKLEKVETKSVGNIEDIQKLFSQVSTCNKSLETESKRVNQVQANISSINSTISKLTEDVARLSEGLKSAPELKQLPAKLQTVSKTLADLGSDVNGMKDTVSGLQTSMKDANTKLKEASTQLDLLKQNSDDDKETDNAMSPEVENMIQSVQQKLQDMNGTLSAQVSVMMKSLSQHEERFTQLDDITDTLKRNLSAVTSDHSTISSEHASMTDVYTSDQFKASVADVVNSVLAQTNHTEAKTDEEPSSSSSSSSASSVLISVKDTLDKIQARYDNISVTVQKNKDDIGDIKENFVPMLSFNTVREEFQKTVESLNATLMQLKVQGDMKSVTSAPTQSAKTPTSQSKSSQNNKKATTTTKVSKTDKANTVAPTESPNTVQPELKSTTNAKGEDHHVKIPGVEDADALDTKFRAWDRPGAGQIAYNILEDYLGPKTPAESDLKPFDKDNNDLYTKQEIADALGITLDEDLLNTEDDTEDTATRKP